jgi:hypothetical protein
MKKYLITGMAAIVFCGAFTSCSHDLDSGGGGTAANSLEETYEKAFITHFGEPAPTQTWGFGSLSQARTRDGQAPSVTEAGYTYNAQLALAWEGVEAAVASGTSRSEFSDMDKYAAWKGSGWADKFYTVNGTVEDNNMSDEYMATIANAIRSYIPEGENNLRKASATGYSVTTKARGKVTLTPIFKQSNSGDQISYYYYHKDHVPSLAEIKTMPKYTIGKIAPNGNANEDVFYKKTYTLVFVDPETGVATEEFPADYVINFCVNNTWNECDDTWAGQTNTIYKEGGITTTTGERTYTDATVVKKALSAEICGPFDCGSFWYNSWDQVAERSGRGSGDQFARVVLNDFAGYTAYTPGNGTNGSLTQEGSTVYYVRGCDWVGNAPQVLKVAVHLPAGKTLCVYNLGNNWDATSGTPVEEYNNKTYSQQDLMIEIPITGQNPSDVYAIFSPDSSLGLYGLEVATRTYSGEYSSSTTAIVNKNILVTPEYYSNGDLNQQIHNTNYSYGLFDATAENGLYWPCKGITELSTPHTAVFTINGKNYIGFEDWVDFDFNDMIIEVTNTESEESHEIPVDVPDETAEIVVIAEDLTIDDAIPDFDFNDVVFKVIWNKTQDKVEVELLAAGGTLPLYIGGTGTEGVFSDGKEVHAEFARVNPDKVITTGTMINTWAGRHKEYTTPSFEVTNYDHSATTIGALAASIKVAVYKYERFHELLAPAGGVPTKIAVKTDFVTDPNMGWCDERQDIDDKYNVDGDALFSRYVEGTLDDNWYRQIHPLINE